MENIRSSFAKENLRNGWIESLGDRIRFKAPSNWGVIYGLCATDFGDIWRVSISESYKAGNKSLDLTYFGFWCKLYMAC